MDQWTGKEGENEKDLIALMGRYEEVDCATRWIYRVVVPYFHRFWGHRRKASMSASEILDLDNFRFSSFF